MYDRRTAAIKRSHRIAAGSLSVPVSIIVGGLIHHYWGDSLGTEFTIAAGSVAGSACTLLSLCFWDIRGLLLTRLRKRREHDGKK